MCWSTFNGDVLMPDYHYSKRAAILIAVILTAANFATAQVEKQIAAIRADVNLINKSAAKYTKQKRDVEGVSLEGTEATYFLSGKGLKKIAAKMYGETFRGTVELYYSGEELIFAFERIEKYNTHIAMTPPPKVVKIEETRLYRTGGKTIRILSGKVQLKADDIKFTEAEYALIELADQLKAGLNR